MRLIAGFVTIIVLPVIAAAVAMNLIGDSGRAASLSGAIFTTTADGTVVNENVHYARKIEVYLDGGPGPNAPQHAAGLPDGLYVFQVTDPPGKVLLSEDPSKCRVVEVDEGVIVELVAPSELGLPDTYVAGARRNATSVPCHVQDSPDGVPGPSGRHDTNHDADHWPPAIVVQLMPFFNTPNNGGVYKAWMMPLDRYEANGGDLGDIPQPLSVKGKQVGYRPDEGFGPPRDQIKTDNFKVKEYFPPEIKVRKFHDIDGDSVWDAGEPEIGVDQCLDGWEIVPCPNGGWPYEFTEPVNGGSVTNSFYTPGTHVAGISGTYTACELIGGDWAQSALYLDGVKLPTALCVDIYVAGASGEKHEVIFGDTQLGKLSGKKFIDYDADGKKEAGDICPSEAQDAVNHDGCADVEVCLSGTDNLGRPVGPICKFTGEDGSYEFTDLYPGTYTVTVKEDPGFYCSYPELNECHYTRSLDSGDSDDDLDFGDFSLGEVRGVKFFDRDGDGERDAGEVGMPDIEIHLDGYENADLDGDGHEVSEKTYTCGGSMVTCLPGFEVGTYWFDNLEPGDYEVTEVTPDYLVQVWPPDGEGHSITLESDEVCADNDFANFGPCNGLTPGYWSNWRNHYTASQFAILLGGTIADIGTDAENIAEADEILESLGCDDGDALHCMARFLLADQLTLNLTQHPELPNPDEASLIGACEIEGIGTLAEAIERALDILADEQASPGSVPREEILDAKNDLAAFAELNP